MLSRVSNTTVTTGTATASRGPVVGSYPCSRSAASTRSRVSGATSGRWLSTLDAVAVETPAARATTFSVARFLARLGASLILTTVSSSEKCYMRFARRALTAGRPPLYGGYRNTFVHPLEGGEDSWRRRGLDDEVQAHRDGGAFGRGHVG